MLWCPGGSTRPYEAPESLGKSPRYFHYIRNNSSTVQAQEKDKRRLYELANQVPFDDRVCHEANLKDLNVSLIKDFLRDIKSDLLIEVDRIPFEQLCRQMQIARGPDEYLKPLNIGLMMFTEEPEHFFPCARIEIIDFHDGVGDSFSEKIFKGPLHIQLKESLRYLRAMFLREEVRKRPDRAEADRFFNYPYIALEEALANAVYHKDYNQREPIEIRIHHDRIEILSFPGPMPPLKVEQLNHGNVFVRTYRNRRIGDMLKELHLTEGRCTGVLKIRKAMQDNRSPSPIFETDADNSYFLTILPVHPEMLAETHQVSTPKTHQATGVFSLKNLPLSLQKQIQHLGKRPGFQDLRNVILSLCDWQPLTAPQLAEILGKRDRKHLVRQHLTPMVKEEVLEYLYPEYPKSPEQAYLPRRRH